jgi:hypothetical protein
MGNMRLSECSAATSERARLDKDGSDNQANAYVISACSCQIFIVYVGGTAGVTTHVGQMPLRPLLRTYCSLVLSDHTVLMAACWLLPFDLPEQG